MKEDAHVARSAIDMKGLLDAFKLQPESVGRTHTTAAEIVI